MRSDLDAAVADASDPRAAADRLCGACVRLLQVGRRLDLGHLRPRGARHLRDLRLERRLSRTLDELQFTFGEGPCRDAVTSGRPVLVDDLDDAAERRWPVLTGALLEQGVRAVYALPIAVSATCLGSLDLYRSRSGPLREPALSAGMWAARLAARPLLDLMTADVDWRAASEGEGGWQQLASLERVEVYQATGVLIAALDVTPAEALVRLRAYAIGALAAGQRGRPRRRRRAPAPRPGRGVDLGRRAGPVMTPTREQDVVASLVSLAGSMATGAADVVELLSELTEDCTRLLDVAATGLLLADDRAVLHVMAASSEQVAHVQAMQLQRAEGPCLDCFSGGRPVSAPDLEQDLHRWPRFVPVARAAGFASVHAVPMRLRSTVLGALGLFGGRPGALNTADLTLAQGMADVASIALVQDRAAADQRAVNEQLQVAPVEPGRPRAGQGSALAHRRRGHAHGVRAAPALRPRP
jgi:hypothetical protein